MGVQIQEFGDGAGAALANLTDAAKTTSMTMMVNLVNWTDVMVGGLRRPSIKQAASSPVSPPYICSFLCAAPSIGNERSDQRHICTGLSVDLTLTGQ